ncbi:hypothetical protein CBER1_07586 [Cercospora berteroae]|uniref:Uncharacterized protein n=1 Tax=Cercospora berteroae TaxID=357750 RepID=A0A2S6BTT8_9PEZI|nr:hypothetical protein CBER1_07586 [Cercospora berteroae]
MSAANEVNAVGQVFGAIHARAWQHFEDEQLEEALDLARRMLLEPRLGNFHRGGFHLLMAFSNDQCVEHAERAVELFRTLRGTPKARRLVESAQNILQSARNDLANGHNNVVPSSSSVGEDEDARDDDNNEEQDDAGVEIFECDLVAMVRREQEQGQHEQEEHKEQQEPYEEEAPSDVGVRIEDTAKKPPMFWGAELDGGEPLDSDGPYPDGLDEFVVGSDEELSEELEG